MEEGISDTCDCYDSYDSCDFMSTRHKRELFDSCVVSLLRVLVTGGWSNHGGFFHSNCLEMNLAKGIIFQY